MTILNVSGEFSSRLDRYLKKLYPDLTQGIIERALRLKKITVNSHKIEAGYRVQQSDQIFIDNSLTLESPKPHKQNFSNSTKVLADKLLNDYLIYQDDYLLAINKPSGLATQAGSKISLSIDDALQYLNLKGGGYKLVHRLDKDTSGILLIAASYESSVKLGKAFYEKIINKTYWALTLGTLKKNAGEISGMIAKNRGGVYQTVQNDPEAGKLAVTHYRVIKTFSHLGNTISLIEFTPLTGRTHQLRFHAKMLNSPIIGDTKYGNLTSNSLSKELLLHAKKIILPSQIFDKEVVVEALLPNYFQRYLDLISHANLG